MNIDAKIEYVSRNNEGFGRLELGGGLALRFNRSPADVTSLQGARIRGTKDVIMLGDRMIATRTSYEDIKFVPDDQFSEATEAYRGN